MARNRPVIKDANNFAYRQRPEGIEIVKLLLLQVVPFLPGSKDKFVNH